MIVRALLNLRARYKATLWQTSPLFVRKKPMVQVYMHLKDTSKIYCSAICIVFYCNQSYHNLALPSMQPEESVTNTVVYRPFATITRSAAQGGQFVSSETLLCSLVAPLQSSQVAPLHRSWLSLYSSSRGLMYIDCDFFNYVFRRMYSKL
jgi:hypothetical protein